MASEDQRKELQIGKKRHGASRFQFLPETVSWIVCPGHSSEETLPDLRCLENVGGFLPPVFGDAHTTLQSTRTWDSDPMNISKVPSEHGTVTL